MTLRSMWLWAVEANYASQAPPEKIWKAIATPTKWPSWHPILEWVHFDGPFQTGSKGVIKVKGFKEVPFTLTYIEKNRRFSFIVKLWSTSITVTFQQNMLPEGGWLYAHRVIVGGFFAPFLRKKLGKLLQRELGPALAALSSLP